MELPIQIKKTGLVARAERILKTDLRYLVQGGSWLAIGQIIASSSVFILAIAFANLIPKETYGIYKYVQSVAGLLTIFGMSGMNTYIAQAVARGAEGTFLSGLRARIRWGFLGGVGAIVVAIYYAWVGNTLLTQAFLIVAVAIPFVDALGLYNVYLQSKKLFQQSIIYFSTVQALSVAALILTLFYTDNVLILIMVYFAPPIVLRIFFHYRTLRLVPPNSVTDPNAVRYGAHLSFLNVIGQVANYLDAIILFHLLGPISVALYSFALAPVEQIRGLYSKNIPALALPKLTNRSMESIDHRLMSRMLLLAALGIGIAIVYFFFVPYIFQLVFPQYMDAVLLSQALAVLLIVALPATYLAVALQAKINIIPPSWLYLAAVPDILHILALIIFIPLYGVYGVVIAKAVDAGIALMISFVQWRLLVGRPTY